MGPPPDETKDMLVEDLISPFSKKWNREKIQDTIPDYDQEILELKTSKNRAVDKYIWLQTNSGIYSTKSGYYAAMKEKTDNPEIQLSFTRFQLEHQHLEPPMLP